VLKLKTELQADKRYNFCVWQISKQRAGHSRHNARVLVIPRHIMTHQFRGYTFRVCDLSSRHHHNSPDYE